MSNFQFLESHWTDLAKLGDLSEKYVYSDPNTSIIKQGMLSEVMVKYMLAYDGIAEPAYDNTHANRIRILKNNDLLPREIDNTLYILRKSRNDAAHNAADEGEKALNNLQLMYELCVWYMQTYGDYNYEPTGYVQPVDMTVCLADLEKENAELEERNQQLLIEIEQIQKNGRADSKRRTVAYQKALNVHLSEAQTRELIDEQLRKVGWEANTTELRYSNGTRPTKGKNLAIAEWPTDSNTGNNGYADYALFIGEKLVGIVEAKKKHTNISSVLDGQCKDYAKMIKSEHQKYVINRFGAYMVPFLYATNGRPYIKQYEQMASRAANDKDVFIPRILGAFGSAVHGKPFCLGQQDVVVKFRVYVRLNVLCISPAGRAILYAFTVLLGVLAFEIHQKPDNDCPGNAD